LILGYAKFRLPSLRSWVHGSTHDSGKHEYEYEYATQKLLDLVEYVLGHN